MNALFYTDAYQSQLRRILPELIRSRELLFDLIWKDIRVRYRYAAMGFLWAVLEPLVMMVILTFVFAVAFKGRIEEYGIESGREIAVFVLSGLIPWQFFSTALTSATRSLVDNRDLVKKVHFPREVIPLSAIGVAVVNYLIGAVLLLTLFTVLMGRLPGWGIVWLPLLFAIQFVLVCGLGLLFSSANAFFRDVAYMVESAVLFGFYATPIFYPPSLVEANVPDLYWLYQLNPMVGLVTAYREALFTNAAPNLYGIAWPALFAVTALLTGAIVFRKNASRLADNL